MKKLIFLFLLLPLFSLAQKTIISKTILTSVDAKGNILKTDSAVISSTVLPEIVYIHDTVYIDTGSTTPTNHPPSANGGGNKTVTLPNGITLTGTAFDSDGSISSVRWIRTATGEIISNNYSTTLSFSVAGNYVYTFTATDNKGATATDQVVVTVNAAPPANRPPSANAGQDRTLQLPGSITISGQGSDPDGDNISYTWSRVDGTVQTFVSSSSSFTLNNPAAGTYTYRLRVLDSRGLDATDDMKLTVVAQQPPTGGNTFQLSFSQVTSDYSRPGAGAEYWYNGFSVPISGVQGQDRYIRFNWSGLNPGNGQYNWSEFDRQINTAIDNNQKFSYGIMTQYLGGQGSVGIANYNGGYSAYPKWVHDQMMTESKKPTLSDGDWVPNYNSNYYLNAFDAFNKALYQHISTTRYRNTLYKDAILWIDIRGYGNFGEWHNWPYGTGAATTATLKRIIDIHRDAYPDIQLQMIVEALNNSWSDANAEVSYYILTQRNQKGRFGIRRDNWGATENYRNELIFENNPRSYNGVQLKTLITERWKEAPITGEPCCVSNYAALPGQVTKYRVVSFGNGNGLNGSSYVAQANKNSGYRYTLTSGSVVVNPGSLAITLNWSSNGTAPTYEDWGVVYELRQGSTVVRSFVSSFTPTLFVPPATKTVTDNWNGIPSGTYDLYIKIINPNGYRTMPLSISGNKSGYLLKSNLQL